VTTIKWQQEAKYDGLGSPESKLFSMEMENTMRQTGTHTK